MRHGFLRQPDIRNTLLWAHLLTRTRSWRSFGGVWGVAIPAAVFNSRVNELVVTRLTDERMQALLSNGGAYALAAGGQVGTLTEGDPELMAQVRSIYVDSLSLSWYVALGFALLGFIISAVVKEVTLRTDLVTEFGLEERSKDRQDEHTKSPRALALQQVPAILSRRARHAVDKG